MTQKKKIRMIKDFILFQQGLMSAMYFTKKWQLPYIEFCSFSYLVELTDESCLKKGIDFDEKDKDRL